MAVSFKSSSPSKSLRILSASQRVSISFSSTLKYVAILITWLLFARLSPRSILLNMGVSISKYAATWRCNIPFSSLRDLILFPNNISYLSLGIYPCCIFSRSFGRFSVGTSSNGRFFGRIMIKPTDCCLLISISNLSCLLVFLHLILLIVCRHSEVVALPSCWLEAHL